MSVASFVQPDQLSKTQDAAGAQAWMTELESALSVIGNTLNEFAPCATTPPSMNVTVQPGKLVSAFGSKNKDSIVRSIPVAVGSFSQLLNYPVYGFGDTWILPQGNGASKSSIFHSSDGGETWTSRSMGTYVLDQIAAYGAGLFVVVHSLNTALNAIYYTSPDGITWTTRTAPWGTGAIYRLLYANGLFIAWRSTGTTYYTSPDGINWTTRTLTGATNLYPRTLGYGNGVWAIWDFGTLKIWKSTDAITWTSVTPDHTSFSGNVEFTYGNGVWMSWNGSVWTSPDLVTWTDRGTLSNVSRIAFGAGYFALARAGQNKVTFTVDGTSYGTALGPVSPDFGSLSADYVGYGQNKFLIVPVDSSRPLGYIGTTHVSDFILGTDESTPQQVISDSIAVGGNVAISSPVASPRIDRIGINVITGALRLIAGTESDTPVAPAYPDGTIPVCSIKLVPGQTVITNAHITDERCHVCTETPYGAVPGINAAFNSSTKYECFNSAGTFDFPTPPQATFMRLTIVGAGGGGGGSWVNSANTSTGTGGGGGGGACLPNVVVAAQDLTVVIGAGGAGGLGNTLSTSNNDATAGSAGEVTTVTGSLGLSLSVNGGNGGGKGTSTPGAGAGGAGGTAPTGGFAGGVGAAGTTGIPGVLGGGGGATGEQLMLSAQGSPGIGHGGTGGGNSTAWSVNGAPGGNGFIMIEWW